MIKTLASLNADLASDIAFRYSNRLSKLVDMNLQAIHVEEVEGPSPGTGWVRNTLERGLLHTAQEEISDLIKASGSTYSALDTPIIRVGEREHELLREIKDGGYDLFMEGLLNSFSPTNFYRRMQSGLYRNAPCPILMVRNMVELNRTAILLRNNSDLASCIPTFLKIFTKPESEFDLIRFSFPETGKKGFKEKAGTPGTSSNKDADKLIKDAEALLAEAGHRPREILIIQDKPDKLNEFLTDYGLVVIQIPKNPAKKNRVMELLSHTATAILLCRR